MYYDKVYLYRKIKKNMENLNDIFSDIFNTTFFKDNFQTEIDDEEAELKATGWTRADIDSIVKTVTNK